MKPLVWAPVTVPAMLLLRAPMTKGYQADVSDGHLSVFVARDPRGDGELRWHLSISHRRNDKHNTPGRYPKWDEIKDARYRFCPDKVTMAMLLPPQELYVNVHETTFQLWEIDDPA